jgi:hypothetical protein
MYRRANLVGTSLCCVGAVAVGSRLNRHSDRGGSASASFPLSLAHPTLHHRPSPRPSSFTMSFSLLLPLLLLSSASSIQAAPSPTPRAAGTTLTLAHTAHGRREGDLSDWVVRERKKVDARYGSEKTRKGLYRRDTTIT